MPLPFNTATNRYEPDSFDYSEPESSISNAVGMRIADARHFRGINQTQLAEMAGVKQTTISSYERAASAADFNRLVIIALKLQIDPAALMALPPYEKPDASVTGAKLKATYTGAYWPASIDLPETPRPYAFAVYAYTDSLSLAVVKKGPDPLPHIDPETDHLRLVIPGSVDHAVLALERELRRDAEYLTERGFDVDEESVAGIALDCPHPSNAFLDDGEVFW